ncbi:MAG: hypothetical protein JW716_05785 [Candidatus Aenigmarchaeota archaeon]|nr:hypothetical protein [Candidatus Aenigmarchaeota archaeon]
MAESIIAAIILISFLAVLSRQPIVPTYTEDMSVRGYRILMDASQKEAFRYDVYSEDFTNIISSLEIPGYYYNVSICDYSGSCNGHDPLNTNATIWASSYIFSGNGSYEPKILRLYIWR